MNDPHPLLTLPGAHLRSHISTSWDATGLPTVRGQFSRTDTIPESITVEIRHDEQNRLKGYNIKVEGRRARKDGSPGLNTQTAEFMPSILKAEEAPGWVLEYANIILRGLASALGAEAVEIRAEGRA